MLFQVSALIFSQAVEYEDSTLQCPCFAVCTNLCFAIRKNFFVLTIKSGRFHGRDRSMYGLLLFMTTGCR